jgi:anti-sigma regulatory factor (Ser/Thr protein kinase)
MSNVIKMSYEVPANDFTRAGEASSSLKSSLKKMGVDPEIVRKVSIAMYEGEINMVIHASGGRIDVTVSPEEIEMILRDQGPVLKISNWRCRPVIPRHRIIFAILVSEQGWDCRI